MFPSLSSVDLGLRYTELKQSFDERGASGAQIRDALDDLDRFVRGTRFSWDAFLEHRFDELSNTPHQAHRRYSHRGQDAASEQLYAEFYGILQIFFDDFKGFKLVPLR